jgi:dihydrofolate reductase
MSRSDPRPRIAFVVAVGRNNVIGKDGRLPWRLPDDMRHVREVTMGKPLIMGRRTFDSIGRALPGRANIVLTRDPTFRAQDVQVARTPDEAIALAGDAPEIIVFGGQQIFDLFMTQADRIYLTRVDADVSGDTYFSFDPGGWRVVDSAAHGTDERHPYAFRFETLDRVREAERAR